MRRLRAACLLPRYSTKHSVFPMPKLISMPKKPKVSIKICTMIFAAASSFGWGDCHDGECNVIHERDLEDNFRISEGYPQYMDNSACQAI